MPVPTCLAGSALNATQVYIDEASASKILTSSDCNAFCSNPETSPLNVTHSSEIQITIDTTQCYCFILPKLATEPLKASNACGPCRNNATVAPNVTSSSPSSCGSLNSTDTTLLYSIALLPLNSNETAPVATSVIPTKSPKPTATGDAAFEGGDSSSLNIGIIVGGAIIGILVLTVIISLCIARFGRRKTLANSTTSLQETVSIRRSVSVSAAHGPGRGFGLERGLESGFKPESGGNGSGLNRPASILSLTPSELTIGQRTKRPLGPRIQSVVPVDVNSGRLRPTTPKNKEQELELESDEVFPVTTLERVRDFKGMHRVLVDGEGSTSLPRGQRTRRDSGLDAAFAVYFKQLEK
ncbi:UNVERIFIED_CONTAM: hypothetical protein HDU68_000052 [Siphonaria sp. JEL0065]|nr:hypothetical protein HDU68_000052 [Siphonaria sp. JEL0065]